LHQKHLDLDLKPLGIKRILFKDDADNMIVLDADNKVCVINSDGLLVNPKDSICFLESNGFKTENNGGKLQTIIHDTFDDLGAM
jgi:hypothetical protein